MLKKILKYIGLFLLFFAVLTCALYWKRDIPVEALKAKYAPAPSKFVRVQGMEVHYRDEGNPADSVPVVLIHGTGSSLHTWEPCVRALKGQYRIITLDLPAYGLTGPNPARNYSHAFYTEFIAAFLTQLKVDQCILGGNSLGGGIAWQYAGAHPEHVRKLILIDAGGYPMAPESVPIAFKLARTPVLKWILQHISPRPLAVMSARNVYADPDKVTEATVDRYYELFLRKGNRQAFVDRMQYFQYPDNTAGIRSIQIPTLVLWGEQDRLIPVKNAYFFHNDLPHDTLVVLPNAGHVPMEEAPERTTAVMADFLAHFK